MVKCSSCGASFEDSGLRCPYCGSSVKTLMASSHIPSSNSHQGNVYMLKSHDSFSNEIGIRPAKEIITHTEIESHVLDAMVMGALEVAPKETVGILFGREDGGQASIRQAQLIQEALVRTAYLTAPNPISEERIAEAEDRVTDLDFLGSYHSHPYFLKAFKRREDGLCLSQGDVAYLSSQPRVLIELVLGCFPWQIWDVRSGFDQWQDVSAILAGSDGTPATVAILCRSLDYSLPSEQLIAVIKEAIEIAKQKGEAQYAVMMEREIEEISKFKYIWGFDALIAGHARTASGFKPVSLKIGYSPSTTRCPICGAGLGTGETSCRFCGTSC